MKKSIFIIITLVIGLYFGIRLKNFIKNHTIVEPIDSVSCATDATKCPALPISATTTVSLGINDTFAINGLIVKPLVVTEDSRCPLDVRCIQAGRVRVNFGIGSSTVELEIGKMVNTNNFNITLDDVRPYPVTTHKIIDSEYSFLFTIKTQ